MSKIQLGSIMRGVELFSKLRVAEVPADLAGRLRKNLKVVFAEINDFEELKNEMIKKHGVANENGDIMITPNSPGHEVMTDFVRTSYLGEIVTDYKYEIFTEELESITNITISVDDFDYLEAIGFTKELPVPDKEDKAVSEEPITDVSSEEA